MSDYEKELIHMIREHENPAQAFEIALKLMIDFLDEREAPQDTSSVHPRATA